MEENQRVIGPYGNIFQVGTPALDRMGDRLYVEQKQREQLRLQQQRQLDDEFAKNMGGVKDVDVPEIAKKYGDWKLHYQQLQKKGVVSPEEQLENLRKKADIYQTINASKSEKDRDEKDLQLGRTHPENLVDNYDQILMQRRKTPTSQLYSTKVKLPNGQEVFLGDYNLMYSGDNYNSAEDLAKAKGQLLTNEKELGDKKETYQFYGNTPNQVKDYILGAMGKREANKFYINKLMNLPEDELTKTDTAYQSIPDSQFELMGQKKPKLTYDNLDNKADIIATYYAQKAALENVPRKIKSELSEKAKSKLIQDRDLYIANYKHSLGLGDEENANKWLDNWLDSKKSEAQKSPISMQIGVGTGWEIPMDANLRKAFTVQVGKDAVQPDRLVLSKDGKYVPVYYKYDDKVVVTKENDFPVVDYKLTVPHSQDDVKIAMGVKVGQKQVNKEMEGSAKPTKKTYSYNGKTYTAEQIEKAAKQNNVTVEEYLKQSGIK